MALLQTSGFTWKEFLLGSEDWNFLPETMLRSVVMFLVILISLRLLGKRGVKQLSVFELVVIIGLGSAAGDPMFYKDVGILPALIVFIIVVSLYSLVTYLIGKNKKFETLVEGKSVTLIRNGVFLIDNFKKEILGADEFFAELRIKGVSQLGQVEEAIEESSGHISLFFYPDEKVSYGLPIMPDTIEKSQQKIKEKGYYSCLFCAHTEQLVPATKHTCPKCKKYKWVASSKRKRVV